MAPIKAILAGKGDKTIEAYTSNPNMDGTASAGSSVNYSRGDHRHPTDTSREAVANKVTSLNASSTNTQYPSAKAVYNELQDINTSISEKASIPYQTRISFSASWQGNDPYTQEVMVKDATINSRVDLHPDTSTLVQLVKDGVSALYIENNEGIFTAKSLGGPPSVSMGMLATVTEVKMESSRLTFTSPSDFTLAVANHTKNWDGTLEYSTDGKNWAEWDGTTTLSSGERKRLYLRGTGNSVISNVGAELPEGNFVLTGSNISCSGNIETLLDYETVASGGHPQMEANCFFGLFYQNAALVKVPELPAPILPRACYAMMFSGCTSLVSAPVLPATTLEEFCYSTMFEGCTSLVNAPELPATTLDLVCYTSMFEGCTSLVNAPELPATTLGGGCYLGMFSGCTSLVTAPALPATTLENDCYASMFEGCTSLVVMPALPATVMKPRCYNSMFYGCTSLKISETQDSTYAYPYRIPASGTGTGASTVLTDMFSNTGGTFTGTPTINVVYYTDHEPVGA